MSDSFVDDTQNGLNDAHLLNPLSLDQLIRSLENMAQTWERLLYSSGGGLELSKCFYIIVYWKWIKGLPVMLQPSEMDHIPPIKITSGFDVSTGKFGPLTAISSSIQLNPISLWAFDKQQPVLTTISVLIYKMRVLLYPKES